MFHPELYNPHQNINININYNLASDKLHKNIVGKKVQKTTKVPTKETNTLGIQIKLHKKNCENNIKKSNQTKKSTENNKKIKKKCASLARNTYTPDIFAEKKVKTEGHLNTEQDLPFSTYKKQSKLFQKSVHQPLHKSAQISSKLGLMSKKVSAPKIFKAIKAKHMNSCMLYESKKYPMEFGGEHIISQVINAAPAHKKKRAYSAITIKNDKIVSKLLNMSLLASELGGSQPITSERKQNDKNAFRALKEYMNSIDLKIIKRMENDVPFFKEKTFQQPNIVKNILRRSHLSLEDFTEKVIVIQREWRKKIQKDVRTTYQKLFSKLHEQSQNNYTEMSMSGIDIHSQTEQEDSSKDIQIFTNDQLITKMKLNSNQQNSKYVSIDEFHSSQIENTSTKFFESKISQEKEKDLNLQGEVEANGYKLSWAEEIDKGISIEIDYNFTQKHQRKYDTQQRLEKVQFQESEFKEEKEDGQQKEEKQAKRNLNISKLQELVKIEKIKQAENSKTKSLERFKEEQIEQWNNINKKISNVLKMNEKGVDSKNLLDELIKQSDLNKKWILEEEGLKSQSLSQKESFKSSISELEYEQEDNLFNKVINLNKMRLEIENNQSDREKVNLNDSFEHSQEEEAFQDSEEYDCRKYADLKKQRERIQVEFEKNHQSGLRFHQNQRKGQSLESRFIADELLKNEDTKMVQNYLDCELDGFGLHGKMPQNILKKQTDEMNENEQEENVYGFSDQAIGPKFQRGNLAIPHQRDDQENNYLISDTKSLQSNSDNSKVFEETEFIINYLICQFATDISIILKKNAGNGTSNQNMNSNNQQLQRNRNSGSFKNQGISTNFNSIKEYLSTFIEFVKGDTVNMDKIGSNINKDIGPSSSQILTYLRPEAEGDETAYSNAFIEGSEELDDEEGLFVIPAEMFQMFETYLEDQIKAKTPNHLISNKTRAYLNFWHRCIFQSFNQCLDHQRPYGIQGKPYEWVIETKLYRQVKHQHLSKHLHKAESRLLELTSFLSGIIFEKMDSPFAQADLMEDQKHLINEERLSRMLATELFETEQSWINYNDEMAELLVELSRMIEDRLFFEFSSEMKRLQRRRKIISEEANMEEPISFNIQQL